jgi:hypothetical protein
MPSTRVPDYSSVALKFASALTSRDYPSAYAMTSSAYHHSTTVDEMRAGFEAVVPTDWRS